MSVSLVRAATRRPVLITGGAGFIGTNLAHRLLRAGRRVRIYDNLSRPGAKQNLRWLLAVHGSRVEAEQGDVRSTEQLRHGLTDIGTVFHPAAQVAVTTSLSDPSDDFAVNGGGTLNLLELIRETARHVGLVFTPTNKAYGPLEEIPFVASQRATVLPLVCAPSTRPVPSISVAPMVVQRAPPINTFWITRAATQSLRRCFG